MRKKAKKSKDSLKPISELLGSVIPKTKTYKIWLNWNEVAGELAPYCKPVAIKNGVLIVRAEQSVLLEDLSTAKQDLLARARQIGGKKIQDVHFVWGTLEQDTQRTSFPENVQVHPSEERVVLAPLTQADIEFAEQCTKSISNPELREALKQIILWDRRKKVVSENESDQE